jgi:hypothetical protein
MSNKLFSLAVVAALLALPMSQLFAQGTRIVLGLRNQEVITCRLLSVRDSALVVSTNEARGNHIDAKSVRIIVVKNQDIRYVLIKGKSRALLGMGIGLLIGAGTGAMIGHAEGDDEPCYESTEGWSFFPNCWGLQLTAEGKAVIGGILGGITGSLVGTIVGGAASKEDNIIYPHMHHDLSALKSLAKFPEKEPDYLSAVK